MISAAAMGLGFFLMARYGDNPVKRQNTKIHQKLFAFLEKEGLELNNPEWQEQATAYRNRTALQKAEDYVYAHPFETVLSYIALAHSGLAVSGMIRKKSEDKYEKGAGDSNFLQGLTLTLGCLFAAFVPEKTKAQLKREGKEGTFMGALQARPMTWAGMSFIVGDTLGFYAADQELKKARKKMQKGDPFRPYVFAMSAISFISALFAQIGNFLVGFKSSKKSKGYGAGTRRRPKGADGSGRESYSGPAGGTPDLACE
jgi:ElaB/YqjD/DUF883 family membrane-anchored ribosome-binding protein